MNVRIKFSKFGALKYVGHLDFMRYFQKAIRRAGIDITYSQGFNPHQVMSFAMPLSLGTTSDGEYLDIELNSYGGGRDVLLGEGQGILQDIECLMLEQLNNVMAEGVKITRFIRLPDWELNKKKITAMSLVAAADYKASFKTEDIIDRDDFTKEFKQFMDKDKIPIQKKTKKSEIAIDLKAYIYDYAFTPDEFAYKTGKKLSDVKEAESHAENYLTSVYLKLAAGSAVNIKPELVLESFFECIGKPLPEYLLQIHRMELYQAVEDGKTNLVPLSYVINT